MPERPPETALVGEIETVDERIVEESSAVTETMPLVATVELAIRARTVFATAFTVLDPAAENAIRKAAGVVGSGNFEELFRKSLELVR